MKILFVKLSLSLSANHLVIKVLKAAAAMTRRLLIFIVAECAPALIRPEAAAGAAPALDAAEDF